MNNYDSWKLDTPPRLEDVPALAPVRLHKEVVKKAIDRAWCDQCDRIIRVDNVMFWDRETSATYCSMECAKADPVNAGREVVES